MPSTTSQSQTTLPARYITNNKAHAFVSTVITIRKHLQSCLKIENKPIMPVTYHCDFLGSKLLSPFQGPLLSSKKKHMEAVQSNTTERAQRSPRPPTISQHGRSRAGHEEPADPTENQAVLRQERYWLQSLVCSCTSQSQLGTKVSLRLLRPFASHNE